MPRVRIVQLRILGAMLGACWAVQVAKPMVGTPYVSDMDQNRVAMRLLWEGRDPYATIGPHQTAELRQGFRYLYPLTAPLVVAPLAWLTAGQFRLVWVALTAFAFLFLASRDGLHRMLIAGSGAFYMFAYLVQWTPALATALFVPATGFLIAAKPQLGLAVLAGLRSWRDLWIVLTLAAALSLASVILWPWWPSRWLAMLGTADHVRSLVSVPGGPLLLLALIRWRQWEGRLLAAMAIIPQTPSVETTLLLLLIPQTWAGVTVLAVGTWITVLAVSNVHSFPSYLDFSAAHAQMLVLTVYLPALVMVLRRPKGTPAEVGHALIQ